jgi:hypothetical protein
MNYKRMRCDKLQHPIESGWAMRHHSKTCGRYRQNPALTYVLATLIVLGILIAFGVRELFANTP